MKKFLERLMAFFSPPLWLLLPLIVISTLGLVLVFTKGYDSHPLGYGLYAISAYTVTALTVVLCRGLPGCRRRLKVRIYKNPLGRKYLTDRQFRVLLSLYISLIINCAYAAFKLAAGIYYASLWWGAVAVYYMVLALMRFLLLRYVRSAEAGQDMYREYRQYGRCGVLLVLLHMSLTGIVFQMVRENQSIIYPEVMVIAMAAYTFYTVSMSLADVLRYRKYKSPVLLASRDIRLAAALVSLLSLESAMLARYGQDETFRRLMTGLTGAAVCLTVLSMSVYMVVHATVKLRQIFSADRAQAKEKENE